MARSEWCQRCRYFGDMCAWSIHVLLSWPSKVSDAEMCNFSHPGERVILIRTVTEVLKEPVRLWEPKPVLAMASRIPENQTAPCITLSPIVPLNQHRNDKALTQYQLWITWQPHNGNTLTQYQLWITWQPHNDNAVTQYQLYVAKTICLP